MSPKVFRLLRDRDFNSDIVYSPSFYFRNHHGIAATTNWYLSLRFWVVVFPFPKVFRLIRNGSTSRAPPLIIDTDGNFDDIFVYPLAIALLTPSPFCVTCLSRLAFEYCRQRYLCTLVIIDPPFHCIYTISYWYHHIIPCVTRLFPHIHNCYLGLCIVAIYKKIKRE